MNIERIKKLQTRLEFPLLIKKPENLFYLLDRKYLHGYLLLKPQNRADSSVEPRGKSAIFFGDGLEKPPQGIKSERLKNLPLYLAKAKRLELEDEFTFAEYNYIKLKVKSGKSKVKISHIKSPVDFVRAVKDDCEIAMIKKSMQIVEKVFKQVKGRLKLAPTEIALAEFIKKTGLKFGAEDVSFPPIVASGTNASIPHHVPSSKKIKKGESVIIDMGFKYKGYSSDFTRTVFLKTVPKKLEIAYNQVEKAYLGSIELINENVGASFSRPLAGDDVYQKAVDILAEKYLEKYFIHSLGHGTGLEIHELPNLSPKSKDVLSSGMVFSIEPGVYIPKLGGIRIEDLVYLKQGKVKKFIKQPTTLREQVL
jgi:Xaa-Pro aminopeptidase